MTGRHHATPDHPPEPAGPAEPAHAAAPPGPADVHRPAGSEPVDLATLTVADGLAVVTLNRPDALNALSPEVMAALDAVLDRVEADDTVRCTVFRGAGRAFSAGGDLRSMLDWTAEQVTAHLTRSHALRDRVAALPHPTIAAVHGHALGGGLELAICCDLILCATSARLGLPEARVGLLPGSGGCSRLPRLIGPLHAKHLVLTGRTITADEAFRIGLATLVVPDHELDHSCAALYADLVRCSPTALRHAKHLIDTVPTLPPAEARAIELTTATANYAAPDRPAGMRAALDRTPPPWLP